MDGGNAVMQVGRCHMLMWTGMVVHAVLFYVVHCGVVKGNSCEVRAGTAKIQVTSQ